MMGATIDIDRITAISPPVFNGVQFASKPAALRQLLMAQEILNHVNKRSRGLDVGSKYPDLSRILSAYDLRCLRLDLEPRESQGEFVLGNGEQMPFRDASFDYVILSHVLAHVEDLDNFLTELGRILRPGGKVFILQSNRFGWWKFWGYYLRRNDRRFHHRTFDVWDIRRVLSRHRIKIINMYAPYHFYLHAKYSDLFYWLDRRLMRKVPNILATQWLVVGRKVHPEEPSIEEQHQPRVMSRSMVTVVAIVHALVLKSIELGLRLVRPSRSDGETT